MADQPTEARLALYRKLSTEHLQTLLRSDLDGPPLDEATVDSILTVLAERRRTPADTSAAWQDFSAYYSTPDSPGAPVRRTRAHLQKTYARLRIPLRVAAAAAAMFVLIFALFPRVETGASDAPNAYVTWTDEYLKISALPHADWRLPQGGEYHTDNEGLQQLHDALCEAGHELDVVAPLTEQSGVGCSVTLHNPLRLYPVQEPGFSGTAVAGTPVDCVKLALTTLLPQPPDLVVVGINNGANKGVDVFYSGTVGAATEAALRGLPAVAFSRPRPELEPPQALARHAASLVDAVDWRCCAGKVLNVNYPRCRVAESKGIRAARMAESRWAENYERREDPAGRPYWWIADFLKRDSGGDDTDIALMEGNWVAVTPLQVDRTDRELLGRLQERFGV